MRYVRYRLCIMDCTMEAYIIVYALHNDCIKTTVTQILDIDYVCQKFTCVGGKCKFLVKNGQTHNR